MFRRQHHIAYAKHRIRTGSEYFYTVACFLYCKAQQSAFTAANPVFLHDAHFVWPTAQFIQVFQQTICIIGNFKEPLFQRFLFYHTIAAFALSFYYLFISQYSLAARTPVYRCAFFISQTFFIKLQKEPLGPFIVFGQASGYLSVPIIAQPHCMQLAVHIGNIFFRPFCRRCFVFDSCVFRR